MKTAAIRLMVFCGIISLASCSKERSPVTAWEYNEPKNGGFDVPAYEEQETGPGLVLIEGGTFTMGRARCNLRMERYSSPSECFVFLY
jgi:formylglycine-generating enzyme